MKCKFCGFEAIQRGEFCTRECYVSWVEGRNAQLERVAEAARGLPEELKSRNPWPVSIFTLNDDKEYMRLVPDPKIRTAVSGFLMREGWRLCVEHMQKYFIDEWISELEEPK